MPLMLQRSVRSRNMPTATDDKTTKVLSVLVATSLVGAILEKKIIKIVATRCDVLKLKCTKIRFRLGLRPTPAK